MMHTAVFGIIILTVANIALVSKGKFLKLSHLKSSMDAWKNWFLSTQFVDAMALSLELWIKKKPDGYCVTKWKNGRFVSVGDCQNTDPEDSELVKTLKKNVATAKEKELMKTWFKASNGLCYKLYAKSSYKTANSNCKKEEARLASICIRDPLVFRALIKSLLSNQDWGIWIGLDDMKQENVFTWSDGVISKKNSTPWADNEPNSNRNQDCVKMAPGYGWKLNDQPCADLYSYLCEKEVE
ncbi:C-type lection lectoxin-Enh3-like [Styela clava]